MVNFIQERGLNMGLPRNTMPQEQTVLSQQLHLMQNTSLTEPQQELNRLWQNILTLREQDRQNAEDKYQVSLLLATTDKLCRTLTDFMTATENELKKMNSEQMKLLNLQEQYKNEIKAEADKILVSTYQAIKDNQKSVFDNMFSEVQTAIDGMKDNIQACSEKCSEATDNVTNSINKLRRVESIGDLLFYLAPILVLGDVVLRLVEVFT